MKKRLACIVLAALMVVGSGFVGNLVPDLNSSTVYAESLPGSALKFNSVGDRNVIQSQTAEIKYQITNQTNEPITYDEVKVNFEDSNGLKAKVNSTGSVTLKAKGSQSEIGFSLTPSRYYPTGALSYSIVLLNEGEEVYTSKYLYVTVLQYTSVGDYANPNYVDGVEIYSSIEPEDGLYIGSDNTMYFELYNAGNNRIKNGVLTLSGFPTGVGINGGSNSANIGYMNSGETKSASFNLKVEDSTLSGNYLFTATLEGLNQSGTTVTFSKSFYYYVYAKEGDKEDDPLDAETNPRIMVQGYSCGGGSVAAGSTFNLSMDLLNTSKKNLYNIKLSISGGEAFIPVGTSNSFYIEKLDSKTTTSKTLTLNTPIDTTQGSNSLSVSLSYEDAKGNTYTSEDTISIRVTQPSKLVLGAITLPAEAFAGEQAYGELKIINMGKTTLSNVMADVSGNFSAFESNSSYMGNMASGSEETYSFYMIPDEPGLVEGTVIITYEDVEGNSQMEEVPFSFEAMDYSDFEDPWFEPEEPVEETVIPWKLIIGGGIILLLIIGFIVFKKIRKARLDKKLAIEDAAFELAHDAKTEESKGEDE